MSVQDFFGKKLGGWVYNAAAHLSPIDLRAGELGTKIASAWDKGGMVDAGGAVFGALKSAIGSRGSYSIGDWFAGRNIGETAGAITGSIRNARIAARVGVPAAMGLAGFSGLVSPDNPLDRLSRTGLGLGTNAAVAGIMGNRVGWAAGAAYAGWTGLNVLRPGDNFGPF